jgi:hypothetical protein
LQRTRQKYGVVPEAEVRCRVCGKRTRSLWDGRLMDLTVKYFEGNSCVYVQTEYPYWLSVHIRSR